MPIAFRYKDSDRSFSESSSNAKSFSGSGVQSKTATNTSSSSVQIGQSTLSTQTSRQKFDQSRITQNDSDTDKEPSTIKHWHKTSAQRVSIKTNIALAKNQSTSTLVQKKQLGHVQKNTSSSVTATTRTLPPGIKNNNPGNIRHGVVTWPKLLLSEQQLDKNLVTFQSMENGICAIVCVLACYQMKYHANTVDDVLHWWSSNENNTTGNVYNVIKSMSIDGNTPILIGNNTETHNLVKAIITQENGPGCVTDTQIDDGLHQFPGPDCTDMDVWREEMGRALYNNMGKNL
jgi:hypothetical protein